MLVAAGYFGILWLTATKGSLPLINKTLARESYPSPGVKASA